MNWADLVIIGAVFLFALSGYYKGALRQVADIVSLVLAIFVSIFFYSPLAAYISESFSINPNLSKLVAFFILWVGVQFVFNIAFHFLYPLIPEAIRKSQINKATGTVPGLLWGVLFVSLVVMIIAVAPFDSKYRSAVTSSVSGKYIMGKTAVFEDYLTDLVGDAINETLTFLTVKPNSDETVDLGFKLDEDELSVCKNSEEEMLVLVNEERESRDLNPLEMDDDLRELARVHSTDMFVRGYFAHENPDGQDPFDRMKEFDINFKAAGENLALAPNVELAHEGLMNSPGHRANILTAEFGKVGIGCIDGGGYGKMFSQEFTD